MLTNKEQEELIEILSDNALSVEDSLAKIDQTIGNWPAEKQKEASDFLLASVPGGAPTGLAMQAVRSLAPSCNTCKHLQYEPGKPRFCAAYPQGVPMWFASGDVAHTELVGDEAEPITYEPAEARDGTTPQR